MPHSLTLKSNYRFESLTKSSDRRPFTKSSAKILSKAVKRAIPGPWATMFPISILGFHQARLFCFMFYCIYIDNMKRIPRTEIWISWDLFIIVGRKILYTPWPEFDVHYIFCIFFSDVQHCNNSSSFIRRLNLADKKNQLWKSWCKNLFSFFYWNQDRKITSKLF